MGAATDDAFASFGFCEPEFGFVALMDLFNSEGLLLAELGVNSIYLGVTFGETLFEPVDLLAVNLVFCGCDAGFFFPAVEFTGLPPFSHLYDALDSSDCSDEGYDF